MSTQKIITEAMALPLSERVSLAQTLWQSIGAGSVDSDEARCNTGSNPPRRRTRFRQREWSDPPGSDASRPPRHRMRLIYHPDAEAELVVAARFYQQQVPGLGSELLEAIDRAIGTIQDAPDRWKIIEADVRRYLMPRFPYSIYYRVLPGQLRILAFKHHSRHPDYWRDRLVE